MYYHFDSLLNGPKRDRSAVYIGNVLDLRPEILTAILVEVTQAHLQAETYRDWNDKVVGKLVDQAMSAES